jgi:hypothetical protein
MARIPRNTIFVERDGNVYVVVNWAERADDGVKAKLLRLSQRHLARYRTIAAKGRSQKSIYYYVFGKVRRPRIAATTADAAPARPVRPAVPAADEATAVVPLRLLTADQLHELIRLRLGHDLPGLSGVPAEELRVLWRALADAPPSRVGRSGR